MSAATTARYWRQRRGERRLLAAMVLAPTLAAFVAGAAISACYATTGPVPTCAQDPTQPGCYPPIHDQRADAGR